MMNDAVVRLLKGKQNISQSGQSMPLAPYNITKPLLMLVITDNRNIREYVIHGSNRNIILCAPVVSIIILT